MSGDMDALVWEALLGFGFGPGELECEAEMRAALEAIALPALLERVEAAEHEHSSMQVERDAWENAIEHERIKTLGAIRERDALAAKVALTELERAALTHAIEVYTGPDDDTVPTLRSMLITRAATDDEPTHAQQMEAFGEMG